jgi:hypothetical protein
MGFIELVCPHEQRSLNLSFLQLHVLQHGSYGGSATDRVDPLELRALLRPAVNLQANLSTTELRWFGAAGQLYRIETASDPAGPWTGLATWPGPATELQFVEPFNSQPSHRFYRVVCPPP